MHIKVECPRCAGIMVERRSRTGNEFYACDNYPACKQTMSGLEYARAYEYEGYREIGEDPPGFEVFEWMGPEDFF